mmetsp:Transcript_37642/g.78871  ORF Transcript_37642/g.78871 Transcript_37642/m.78871 type:complete len:80 (-) Transcript_37642:622-861(-)
MNGQHRNQKLARPPNKQHRGIMLDRPPTETARVFNDHHRVLMLDRPPTETVLAEEIPRVIFRRNHETEGNFGSLRACQS